MTKYNKPKRNLVEQLEYAAKKGFPGPKTKEQLPTKEDLWERRNRPLQTRYRSLIGKYYTDEPNH